MASKDFTTDAADIFVSRFDAGQQPQETQAQEPERKPQARKQRTASAPQRQEQERICIMMDSATMEEVRAIAYFNRLKIADIFRAAVEDYIAKYEKKHGKIQGR